MGTDIHLEVERLGEDGLWYWIEHPDRPCDDEFCTDGKYNEKTPNAAVHGTEHYRCRGKGHYADQFWSDRNYDVFAMLADVRNGYGFAGISTGDGFVPISEPRGLPDDLSEKCREGDWTSNRHESDPPEGVDWWEWWSVRPDLGDHTHSWLTVRELLDYDWYGQKTIHRGWVTPEGFEHWRREGRPDAWSGSVSGGNVVHVTNEEMAGLIDSGKVALGEQRPWGIGSSYYTQVEWETTYADSARRFLKILHRDIAPLGDPDKVRIVFGFDS